MDAVDRGWIGRKAGTSSLDIERGRLRFFARAIGETDPIYSDVVAARTAGYADLPAPPTFLFSAELDSGALDKVLKSMGVPTDQMLHAEQAFEYLRPAVAGDTITVDSLVKNIFKKKDGALEFIQLEAKATNQHGQHVATMNSLIVVRR